jgi:uncharacterized membrane protein
VLVARVSVRSKLKVIPRFWLLHGKLFIAVAIGAAVTLSLSDFQWRTSTRLIVGWDSGVAFYLATICLIMGRGSVAEIRRRAAVNDEGAIALLVLTSAAALASLVAVILELGHAPGPYRVMLAVTTILLSWIFMHTIFASHYAHEFYGQGRDDRIGGLEFPGNEDPDYWDFLYYSLVVAMTAQVSDVQITSKAIRRLTTLHGVVSFFFNAAILALTVNIVSNLMQANQ